MSKHLTGPSPSQKIKYGNGPTRILANKKRKLAKHIKNNPLDSQAQDENYKPSYPPKATRGE